MARYLRFYDGIVFQIHSLPQKQEGMFGIYFTKTCHELRGKIQASILEDKNELAEFMLTFLMMSHSEYLTHITTPLPVSVTYDYSPVILNSVSFYHVLTPRNIINLLPMEPYGYLLLFLKLASRVDLSERLIWVATEGKEEFVIECPICLEYYINEPRYFVPSRCSSQHKICRKCFRRWYCRVSTADGKLAWGMVNGYYNQKIVKYLGRYAPFAFFEDERHRQCLICLEGTS